MTTDDDSVAWRLRMSRVFEPLGRKTNGPRSVTRQLDLAARAPCAGGTAAAGSSSGGGGGGGGGGADRTADFAFMGA